MTNDEYQAECQLDAALLDAEERRVSSVPRWLTLALLWGSILVGLGWAWYQTR